MYAALPPVSSLVYIVSQQTRARQKIIDAITRAATLFNYGLASPPQYLVGGLNKIPLLLSPLSPPLHPFFPPLPPSLKRGKGIEFATFF